MIITLTSDIEKELVKQARKKHTTPELLALEILRNQFVPPIETSYAEESENLADFLAEHIGVIHSSEQIPGGARMSEGSGRKSAAGMIEKRQQGRL